MFLCSYRLIVVLFILSNCCCSDCLLCTPSSTVVRSIIFLSRLTITHWMALIILCTSVMSIELRSCLHCHTADYPLVPSILGILSASALGVSSVVTEWILKEHRDIHMPQQTLWVYLYKYDVFVKNSWSVVIAFVRMCVFGSKRLVQHITYTNWNGFAVCLVISEVIRGLSTSYILKKTDSLTSSFIYCFSLIVAALILSSITNEVIPYPCY